MAEISVNVEEKRREERSTPEREKIGGSRGRNDGELGIRWADSEVGFRWDDGEVGFSRKKNEKKMVKRRGART